MYDYVPESWYIEHYLNDGITTEYLTVEHEWKAFNRRQSFPSAETAIAVLFAVIRPNLAPPSVLQGDEAVAVPREVLGELAVLTEVLLTRLDAQEELSLYPRIVALLERPDVMDAKNWHYDNR